MLLLQIDEHELQLFELRNTKSHGSKNSIHYLYFTVSLQNKDPKWMTREDLRGKKSFFVFFNCKAKAMLIWRRIKTAFPSVFFPSKCHRIQNFLRALCCCLLEWNIRCAHVRTRSLHFNESFTFFNLSQLLMSALALCPFSVMSICIASYLSRICSLCFHWSGKIVLIWTI